MNTESISLNLVSTVVQRRLYDGLLFLFGSALSSAAVTPLLFGHIGVAAACNGSGGGCG